MIDLANQDTPAYSEIAPLVGEYGVQVSVHPQALEELQRVFERPNVPLVRRFAENFRLPDFLPPGRGEWGYRGMLKPTSVDQDGWTAWNCIFPSGKDASSEQHWNTLFGISAQLNILYRVLEFLEGPADSKKHQMMAFALTTEYGENGGSIGAKLSPQMAKFLTSLPDKTRDAEIEDRMKGTYEHLSGESLFRSEELHFEVLYRQPKRVDIECSGDRSGLNPSTVLTSDDKGYELLPHNMDSPVQQLTVLSALAALHQKARLAGF